MSLRRSLPLFAFSILGVLVMIAGQSCSEPQDGQGGQAVRPEPPPPAAEPEPEAPADEPTPTTGVFGANNNNKVPDETIEARPCEEGGELCPLGYLCCEQCCLAGLPRKCMPAVKNQCPLPDLSISQAALSTRMYLDELQAGECELEEACVSGPGRRRVLRFDVTVPNEGLVDLTLGKPAMGGDGPFEWAACHRHFHFTDFARYVLRDNSDGGVVLVGRKQAFCARDSVRVDPAASTSMRYDCETQGIQRGWADVYDPTLPCQFIDVTDVPPGTYRLEVEINPERKITELRYDNNIASVTFDLP